MGPGLRGPPLQVLTNQKAASPRGLRGRMLIAQFVAMLSITEFLLRLNPHVPGVAHSGAGRLSEYLGESLTIWGIRDGSAGEGDCGLNVWSEFKPWDPRGGRRTHSCTCTHSPNNFFLNVTETGESGFILAGTHVPWALSPAPLEPGMVNTFIIPALGR